MKILSSTFLLLASTALLSAGVITVPNGDFSTAGNNGSISGNLLSGGQTAAPLGSGPWSAQTLSLAGLLAPPTATIGGGQATITGLLGLGVAGQSNSAQFYQTLSGQSYAANSTYTLSVTLDTGVPLSLNLLGTNGIGIALTQGGNVSVVANSLSAAPGLINLTPMSGTAYQLTLQYVTTAAPPSGDIGVRLFAGTNASLVTASLLGDIAFDNVTLTAIPEPSALGLAFAGLGLVAVIVRRRKRHALVLVAALFLGAQARAGLLTTGQTLEVTLLPNTSYQVTLDVSTNAVGSLLSLLGGETTDPIQIVDGLGNVLGTVPAQDIIDLLDGLTGTATQQITMILDTAGTAVVDPVVKVLDSSLLQVSNVTVTPSARVDRAPEVNITGRKRTKDNLRLKGIATDDGQVTRVEVTVNGKQRKVRGTASWSTRAKLHPGRNRIAVRAFDNTQRVSPTRRLTIVVR